jgi:hypothetical protein
MRWLDVCGYPGSGKSALCDPIWHPHQIRWTPDNKRIPGPDAWRDWWRVCDLLLQELEDHRSYDALKGMTFRSLRKMEAVYWRDDKHVYVQTGFAQRGLGFGWRLNEAGRVELIRDFFRLMPVSLGVVALSCPVEVAQERNRKRLDTPETAHENRDFMVPLMVRPREILIEEMQRRGVPVLELDTTKAIDRARDQLLLFAAKQATLAPASRSDCQMAAVL